MRRLLVCMATVVPFSLAAQGTLTEKQRQANNAFVAQDWAKAAEAYQALIQENPATAQPHFRLGVALIGLKRHNEARGHLITAESLGSPAAQAAFRMAQIHAAQGATDSAFQQLRRATTAGLGAPPVRLDGDPDMAKL